MSASTFATRAALILTGLGFTPKTMNKMTKDMSGGWRMRVALGKALPLLWKHLANIDETLGFINN